MLTQNNRVSRTGASAAFGIRVIDDATGRGVPLVELETVHHLLFVTDSAGWVAILEPDLMGAEIFFHLRSHGYTFAKDGFGYSGARLLVKPGGRAIIRIKRVNIAERVCRLTGGGIYADSVLLGERVPLREPTRSGGVFGQDSALAVVYRGKMLWFWGDTDQTAYPLGNFRTTGAIASFPQARSTAENGLDYRYFTKPDGFAREMCPSARPGPIWISGLTSLTDAGGEKLYASYARMQNLDKKLEQGYVCWDDRKNVFAFLKEIPLSETWRFLDGHPIRLTENSVAYLAGGFCFPVVRVPADRESLLDPAAFEAFTCLTPGGDLRRDTRGNVVYEWQKDAPPLLPQREAELLKQGKLTPDQIRFLPADPSGNRVTPHGGSVTWNPWRKKWLLIATQFGGKESLLGEIFYAEADSPTGPWRRCVKILTHDRYTFYNPVHHPFLDTAGGRIIYFEGTYTAEFSGNPRLTPRYNYNQILYRLDLADPRLATSRAG